GIRRAVRGEHVHPTPRERERRSPPGAGHADDERPPRQPIGGGTCPVGTCPAHDARSPPMGGDGPLRSGYARRCVRNVEASCQMRYGFAVDALHPHGRRAETTTSPPASAHSTSPKPAAVSAAATPSPAAALSSASATRPPAATIRASSSAAAPS